MFWGPAATIKCMNSNLLLRSAARERGEGRVLVVDHGASLSSAVLGDILATVMQRQGKTLGLPADSPAGCCLLSARAGPAP